MKQETENKQADFIIGFALAVWILSMLTGCATARTDTWCEGETPVYGTDC